MILIDNYDSFTYNIVQYLEELGVTPCVFKNDEITVEELAKLKFDSIIISPGAGNPDTAGICMDVIKSFYKTKKILGVCLGFQCIAQFFGAKVMKDSAPCHGKGLPEKFLVTRYHSLKVDESTIKSPLVEIAKYKNIPMAIEHEILPIYGVQFHPEAILSEYGHEIFGNFIQIMH